MKEQPADRVVIGMDPHKRSVTIEVMRPDESVAAGGRFDTDRSGYAAMLEVARAWPERVSRSGFSGGSELTRRR
ncbi:hypothetical protein GCM10028802_04100 [Terrabacter terrigena]